jgi:hypothetical protein
MPDTTFALVLLSLFTTPDKAAEIEGDLLEQSWVKGRVWFWLQVKLACIALFFHGLRQDAGRVLLFSYAIYELMLKLNWWALNPLRRLLGRSLELDRVQMAMTNNLLNVFVAFCIGMLITRVFAKYAGQIVMLAAFMMLGRTALLQSVPDALEIAIFAMAPAILGALVMKWLELRRVAPNDTGFRPSPE